MADEKHPEEHIHSLHPDDNPRRRTSAIDTIAAGFATANILKPPPVVEYGHNTHGNSTTFASAGLDGYYKPSDQWEGLHRYDPGYTWEPADERRVVRKVCWLT